MKKIVAGLAAALLIAPVTAFAQDGAKVTDFPATPSPTTETAKAPAPDQQQTDQAKAEKRAQRQREKAHRLEAAKGSAPQLDPTRPNLSDPVVRPLNPRSPRVTDPRANGAEPVPVRPTAPTRATTERDQNTPNSNPSEDTRSPRQTGRPDGTARQFRQDAPPKPEFGQHGTESRHLIPGGADPRSPTQGASNQATIVTPTDERRPVDERGGPSPDRPTLPKGDSQRKYSDERGATHAPLGLSEPERHPADEKRPHAILNAKTPERHYADEKTNQAETSRYRQTAHQGDRAPVAPEGSPTPGFGGTPAPSSPTVGLGHGTGPQPVPGMTPNPGGGPRPVGGGVPSQGGDRPIVGTVGEPAPATSRPGAEPAPATSEPKPSTSEPAPSNSHASAAAKPDPTPAGRPGPDVGAAPMERAAKADPGAGGGAAPHGGGGGGAGHGGPGL